MRWYVLCLVLLVLASGGCGGEDPMQPASSTTFGSATALDRTGWIATASSSSSSGPPANAIDGSASTRWSSGVSQSNGQWFQVDMRQTNTIGSITMDAGTSTGDYPRGYKVLLSTDGSAFTQVASGTGSSQLVTVTFSAQAARYVKIVQTGSAGNWWSIHELNVLGTTGTTSSTALPRTGWAATASSSSSSSPPGNAIDGNASTRWSSGTAQSNGQWFKVDMLQVYTINSITMDAGTSAGDYPRGFNVLLSTDGSTFTQVASGAGSTQLVTVTFSAQSARFVKIVQTGSAGNWWSIHELNVYGTASGTGTSGTGGSGTGGSGTGGSGTGGSGTGGTATPCTTTSATTPWDPKERADDPDLPAVQVQIPCVPAGPAKFKVGDEASFKAALQAAALGDAIEVTQSFTVASAIVLPDKGSGSSYITIYSTGWDTSPPVAFAENAGNVPHVTPSTPMFTITTKDNGAVACAPHAHHYHFVGLEFRYDPSVTLSSGLFRMYVSGQTSAAQQPHHLIVDRCRLRGSGTIGGASHVRGVILNADYAAVHQSYIDGFLDNNSDAQAIGGWSSNGPLRITNNFLEGSHENVLYGGSPPSFSPGVPSDVEIRFNHMYKRSAWLGTGKTKNLFELKTSKRALIESNLFENFRVDAQDTAINIKTSNDGGPLETGHVTFRYNQVKHVDAGFAKVVAVDYPTAGTIATHDVLFTDNFADEDINKTNAKWFLMLALDTTYASSNVRFRHNTVLGADNTAVAISTNVPSITGLVVTDNVISRGTYGVKAPSMAEGTASLAAVAPGSYLLQGNVVAGANDGASYPAGNAFPATIGDIGLVNWQPSGGGDVSLSSTSPYKGKATDGTDPGADIAFVRARLVGVAYVPAVP